MRTHTISGHECLTENSTRYEAAIIASTWSTATNMHILIFYFLNPSRYAYEKQENIWTIYKFEEKKQNKINVFVSFYLNHHGQYD